MHSGSERIAAVGPDQYSDCEVVSYYSKQRGIWLAHMKDAEERRVSPVVGGRSRREAEEAAINSPRHDPSENF
jgi:hypothetical protein